MTYDSRLRPHQILPTDSSGATVADGTYVVEVAGGAVTGILSSAPVVILPAGSDATDVPAGTPVGTFIGIKA